MAPRGTVPDMDIQLRPQRPMAHPARQQQPKPPPQAPPECAPSPPPEPSALRAAPLPMPEPEPSPIEEPEPATVREPQPEPVPEPKRAAELEPEPEQEAEPEVPAPAAESKAATPSSPPANENPEDEQTPANWRAAGDGGDNVPASPPPIKADPHAAGLPMYLQTSDTLPHTYIPMPVEEEPVQESMPLPDTSPSDPEDTAAYVPPVPLAQVEEQVQNCETCWKLVVAGSQRLMKWLFRSTNFPSPAQTCWLKVVQNGNPGEQGRTGTSIPESLLVFASPSNSL